MSNPLLAAHQLSCSRNQHLLFDQLDLTVASGELLHIVGENGVGKTTLLRLLTGLMPLQTGNIYWRSQEINQVRDIYHREIYYVGHALGIKHELTVLENCVLNWRKDCVSHACILAALARFNLLSVKNQLGRQLSSGQRKRLALLQLILSKAVLWIVDEPFSALDQAGITLLQQIFLEKLQTGGAIILTSHQSLTMPNLDSRKKCLLINPS